MFDACHLSLGLFLPATPPTCKAKERDDLRDLSCRLLCSLLLKALLQNWHLYFFSGASAVFFAGELLDEAAGAIGGG
jgi:hypothetical protein